MICFKCNYFSPSFTVMVDCVLSITGTGVLLFFVEEGGLIRF